MNKIAELLPAANIVLDLDADTKSAAFRRSRRAVRAHDRLSKAIVTASLAARERLGPRVSARASQSRMVASRVSPRQPARSCGCARRFAFDAPDGSPVGQVFVLLVPEHATEAHLQLLSELAQMFSERTFRDQLGTAGDSAELEHGCSRPGSPRPDDAAGAREHR